MFSGRDSSPGTEGDGRCYRYRCNMIHHLPPPPTAYLPRPSQLPQSTKLMDTKCYDGGGGYRSDSKGGNSYVPTTFRVQQQELGFCSCRVVVARRYYIRHDRQAATTTSSCFRQKIQTKTSEARLRPRQKKKCQCE